MRRIPSLGRAVAAVAAAVVLSAASRDSVPTYYSHSEFYSNSSYTTRVGGWLSCPPSQGGYTSWGQWSSYEIHTNNDYAACELAE
jgi:hypothetical protein